MLVQRVTVRADENTKISAGQLYSPVKGTAKRKFCRFNMQNPNAISGSDFNGSVG
jgi:hypothetical protein